MKKTLFILFVLVLTALLALSVSAFQVDVKDEAGLLSAVEETTLYFHYDSETDLKLSNTHFGVLTVLSRYSDDYPSNASVKSKFNLTDSDSALILVLRSYGSSYYYDIYLYGEVDTIFSDADVDRVLDDTNVYNNLKKGYFDAGINSFFSLSANVMIRHYEAVAARKARAPMVAAMMGLITALLVGGGSMLGVFLYYRRKCHGTTYPLDRYAHLQLTHREDRFVGSFVTRTRIPKNNGSRSGGRSGGGGRRGGR